MAFEKLVDSDHLLYFKQQCDSKYQAQVSGKGLSTNDYTTTEKNKLSGIASGAEVNQNAFNTVAITNGNTTTNLVADSKTDTVTFAAGSNITLTPDANADKVIIACSMDLSSYVTKTGSEALTNKTYNGYTLAAACAKSVTTSVTSGSADLITSGAVYTKLADYALKSDVSSVYRYKGSVATYANLPTSGQTTGDIYNVEAADSTHGIKAGDNVAWNGSAWDNLSGIIDLSGYVKTGDITIITNSEIDDMFK